MKIIVMIIIVHEVIVINNYYKWMANDDDSVTQLCSRYFSFQCSLFLLLAFPVSSFLATSRSEPCLCALCDMTSNGSARLVKFG